VVTLTVTDGDGGVASDSRTIHVPAPATPPGGTPPPASIEGHVLLNGTTPLGDQQVYLDLNGNGTIDANEPSATSAADGKFTLQGAAPNGTKLKVVLSSLE